MATTTANRSPLIVQPHLYMGDVTGRPLDYGMVYFGEPNKDPEFYPINIYYDKDLTQQATQPVRTKGGFLNANGDIVEIFALEGTYSVKVLDQYGRKIFYKGDVTKRTIIDVAADITDQAKVDIAEKLDNLQSAINTAAAAGAGANGWTDLLVLISGGRTLRDRLKDIGSAEDFGAKGDGITDDTQAIQAALDAMTVNSKLYFNSEMYRITDSLIIKKSNIRLIGQKSKIKFDDGVNGAVFMANDLVSVDIDGIGSANTATASQFMVAKSVHHLHVTNADFNGMATGFILTDCYFTKLDAIRCQSIGRLFIFQGGTNAFCLTNVSVNGAGNPSIIDQTIGGSIVGCSFEGASGRIEITKTAGLNIAGNYFEGYGNVDTYIRLLGANYKDNKGINIAGNLFYGGANFALELQNVGGINITGNYIGTNNGTKLYCWDASNQSDMSYGGNQFTGTGLEFVYEGNVENASMSPEYKFPIIFQKQKLSARKLQAGENQILNTSGDLSLMRPNSDASAIMTAADLSAFFKTQKMYKDKTIPNLLSDVWSSEKLSVTDDTSLTGAKLYTSNQNGIAKLYQALSLTVGHQYALIFKAKRNTDKNLFITYKDQAALPNYVSDYVLMKNTSWGYTGLGFVATASTMSVGIVSQDTMQSGENFSIAESYLIDLTATFGNEIPSPQALIAALNSM